MDNIKNIIGDVIGQMAERKNLPQNKIDRIWKNLLTPTELEHTQIEGIKDGELMVIVDSPAWVYQMKMKRRILLDRLKDEVQEIKNLKFKIGKMK